MFVCLYVGLLKWMLEMSLHVKCNSKKEFRSSIMFSLKELLSLKQCDVVRNNVMKEHLKTQD